MQLQPLALSSFDPASIPAPALPRPVSAKRGTARYEAVSVTPLTAALGAEITGVDLRKPLSSEVVAEIRTALLEHLVLFFRDQDVTPEQHRAFAQYFGELDIHPYSRPMDGYTEILEMVKEKEDVMNFGGGWHTDMTYTRKPPLGTVLVAREIPESGGDTIWANLYNAYEALSEKMKAILGDLVGLHSAGPTYGPTGTKAREKQSTKVITTDNANAGWVGHPIVRTHPETGRKSIFVNPGHTYYIQGLTEEEGRAILDFLFKHTTKPEFACRFSWTKNTVAFWDNRCTQHVALNDYHGYRRNIHRVVIQGDEPF